jgi:hypothetical protein
MRVSSAVTVVAAVCVPLLVGATWPAAAERLTVRDATHDVAVLDYTACGADCPSVTAAEHAPLEDITRLRVGYRRHEVRLATHARRYAPDDALHRRVAVWRLRGSDGIRWQVFLEVVNGEPVVTLARTHLAQPCTRATGTIDPVRAVWRAVVPAGCIDRPRWVRAGALLEGFGAPVDVVVVDDALREGPESTGTLAHLSRRVHRG